MRNQTVRLMWQTEEWLNSLQNWRLYNNQKQAKTWMRNVKSWKKSLRNWKLMILKEKGDKRLIEQIHYWLDNTVDQMNALEALLQQQKDLRKIIVPKSGITNSAGLKHYDQSISYVLHDHYERAEFSTTYFVHLLIIWKNTFWQRIFKQCLSG